MSLPHLAEIRRESKRVWGREVCNYGSFSREHGVLKWQWKSLEVLNAPQAQKVVLAEILQHRTWAASDAVDRIRWCASPVGEYSVKLGYKVGEAVVEDNHWPKDLLWGKRVLPKAGVFSWMAIQKKILMQDRLAKAGIIGPGRCPLCKHHDEDANHLLLSCPYARYCWNFLQSKLNFSSPRPQELADWFVSWPSNRKQDFFGCIWQIAPSIIIWEIWKERNRRIFKDQMISRE